MQFESAHLMRLLDLLADATGQTLDGSGFRSMSEALQEFREFPETSARYLSEKLYQRLQRTEESVIRLQRDKVEKLCHFLGYQSFKEYSTQQFSPIDQRLQGCLGNWYSVVRCNSGRPDLLISPVRIFQKDHKVYLKLKGKHRVFLGELRLKGGCLFCLLDTGSNKELHLSFKIGMEIHPHVLQGTFSGVSSAEDPIGGRELLLRMEDNDFQDLENMKLNIEAARQSGDAKMNAVANYFQNYSSNNLKISNVSTFDLADLAPV